MSESIYLKEMFKDMLKYAPSKICGILGNTALVPIYTNLLSTEQYGLYSIAIAMLSFLCIIFSDWVGLSGLRFFKKHHIENEIPKYLSTLVGLLAANLVLMFILAVIFREHFYSFFKISPKVFLLILLLVIPVSMRALLFQILRAQIKPAAFTISTILNQFTTILLSVIIIKHYNYGGVSILIGMAISITLINILLIFQSKIFLHYKFGKIHFEILKSLFLYGIPLAITSISLWFITQSNKFILQQQFGGFKEVGLVGVAYSLTFPILMALFAIMTAAAVPRIINLYEEKIDVRPIISKLGGYFILLSLPIVTIVAVYPCEIVSMFANAKFQNANILLPYLAFSAFFLGAADYTTLQYHLAKKTYINMIIKVASAVIGVILNIILIKKMGIIGVGIAALITNLLYFLLSIVVVLPNHQFKVPYEQLAKISISFLPAIGLHLVFLHKIKILPIYQIALLLLLYYLTYWLISNKYTHQDL